MRNVIRFQPDDVEVLNEWLTLNADDERCHVRLNDVSAWRYAVGDGVLTIITTAVILVVTGSTGDYEVTNQLDQILWTSLVEGRPT